MTSYLNPGESSLAGVIFHFIVTPGALSDSHPETLTDPEHSDHAGVASSPPQSGDEVRGKEKPSKDSERKNKLFIKTPGSHHQVLDRFSQTIKTRTSVVSDKKDRDNSHGYSNSYKVGMTNSKSELRYFEPHSVGNYSKKLIGM